MKQQITQILGWSSQKKLKKEKKGLQSAKQQIFPEFQVISKK